MHTSGTVRLLVGWLHVRKVCYPFASSEGNSLFGSECRFATPSRHPVGWENPQPAIAHVRGCACLVLCSGNRGVALNAKHVQVA